MFLNLASCSMAPKRAVIPNRLKPWIDARQRFHLSHAHVQMAFELGLNPKKLGKLANHRQETWKLPLPDFIAKLYVKRFRQDRAGLCQDHRTNGGGASGKKGGKKAPQGSGQRRRFGPRCQQQQRPPRRGDRIALPNCEEHHQASRLLRSAKIDRVTPTGLQYVICCDFCSGREPTCAKWGKRRDGPKAAIGSPIRGTEFGIALVKFGGMA